MVKSVELNVNEIAEFIRQKYNAKDVHISEAIVSCDNNQWGKMHQIGAGGVLSIFAEIRTDDV